MYFVPFVPFVLFVVKRTRMGSSPSYVGLYLFVTSRLMDIYLTAGVGRRIFFGILWKC